MKYLTIATILLALSMAALPTHAENPVVRFVSAPDLINADVAYQAGRAFDMDETDPDYATKKQIILDARTRAGLPTIPVFDSDYDHLNDANEDGILSVQEGYRGGLQAIYESIAAENPSFLTVSGDIVDGSYGLNENQTVPQRIAEAQAQADIFYGAYTQHLADAGIPKMYGVIGDHEIGDDGWPSGKIPIVPTYFENFGRHMNHPSTTATGGYVDAPSRYQADGRVYAVKENNTLLIGVETFDIDYDANGVVTKVYQQSPELAGTPDVNGAWKRTIMPADQIDWLESTLATAQADADIDSVIVLGHLPVNDRSVRTQSTSNMRIEGGKDSPFWQVLRDGGADLYIAGEVHAQSGFMSEGVAHLVGGGNFFSTNETEYTVVEVFEDRIELTLKSIKPIYNGDRHINGDPINEDKSKPREWRVKATDSFQTVGTMVIDTSGQTPVVSSMTGKIGEYFNNYDLPTAVQSRFDVGSKSRGGTQDGYARMTGDFDGTNVQVDIRTNASRILSEESGLRGYSEGGVDLLGLLSDGLEVKPWDVDGNSTAEGYNIHGYFEMAITGLAAGKYEYTGHFHNSKSTSDEAVLLVDEDGTGLTEFGSVGYSGGEYPGDVSALSFEILSNGTDGVIIRIQNGLKDTRIMTNGLELELLAYAGDADGDGDVDLADASELLANWDTASGASWIAGDFDGDGDVDAADAGMMLANWGVNLNGDPLGDPAPAELMALVPEPTTIGLLGLGGLAGLRRRRKV